MTQIINDETKTGSSRGIVVTDLSKHFGSVEALHEVNAYFEQGRIHGLLGRNGAGKTTLMSIICNHGFASSGSVRIDGVEPQENAEILSRTCFVHENQRWHDIHTVSMILGSAQRFYPSWDRGQSDKLVRRFALPLSIRAGRLSRGQRSALAVVIGLSSHAEYTFLDEPYLGLDATAREVFYEELALTQAENPRTFIMSTHLIDECAALLETVTILHQGRVVNSENVEDAVAKAWYLTGTNDLAQRLLADMEILSTASMGPISSIVFRGSLSDQRTAELRANGAIEIRHATLQELVSAIGAIEPQHNTQGVLQ